MRPDLVETVSGPGLVPRPSARRGSGRRITVTTVYGSCSAHTTSAPTGSGAVEKRRRVTAKVVLEFLIDIRRRYPAETTVYIVMDNLSAHWTKDIAPGR